MLNKSKNDNRNDIFENIKEANLGENYRHKQIATLVSTLTADLIKSGTEKEKAIEEDEIVKVETTLTEAVTSSDEDDTPTRRV